MQHVLWIGGPPGVGKTTVASRLARRHGLRLYSSDTRTWAHRDRALEEGNAAAARWERLAPPERWKRAPTELLAMSLHTERAEMIEDDVRLLPASPLVVAEGSPVAPSHVADPTHALWLLPTRAFQRAQLELRGLPAGAVRLYLLLAAEIEREARRCDMPILTVDGSLDVAGLAAAVEARFAAPIAAGPRATTTAERRALVREANLAVVGQVRAYYARPWAEGTPDDVVRTFMCECGDPACDTDLELPVRSAQQAPVLADGH